MQGRQYTWSGGETLVQLRDRRDEILAKHHQAVARNHRQRPNRPLMEVLADTLDDENDDHGCTVCHL